MSNKIIKTVMVMFFTIFATTVCAQQKGEIGIGAGVSVATGDDYTNVGLGAKFQWNPINNLRLEPSFNYFFKKDLWYIWDLSANLHYLFPVGDMVTLYPLAGLGIQTLGIDFENGYLNKYDDSETDFAFNVGAGVDINLTSNWLLNFEFKYKITDINRAVFSLGFGYKF